jgi:hypothetical protein
MKRSAEMRTFVFTLLAIAAGIGVQHGIRLLPLDLTNAMHGIGMDMAWFIVLPILATAGLAYVMRISSIGYVIALAVFSPFISFALGVLFALFILDAPML